MRIHRLPRNPIIRPHMDARMGGNINGPSLIRVPDWVENRLGRYYLYFAHHRGTYIRLAYADALGGPWTTYEPGVLPIAGTGFVWHIASPDAHVDDERREIRMYYHGQAEGDGQRSRVAVSRDGLTFASRPEIVAGAYLRVFRWGGDMYGLSMPGRFWRSRDGLGPFEQGPQRFTPDMRHAALLLRGDALLVFFTNVGDCPERILLSTVHLTPDWNDWHPSEPTVVLEPEADYEGGDLPPEPSIRGPIEEPVRQLRDPAIYQEEGRTYLLYSVAGESGLAIAEVLDD